MDNFNYSDPYNSWNSGAYWMPGFYVMPGYMAFPNVYAAQALAAEPAMLQEAHPEPAVELQNLDAVELPDSSAAASRSPNPGKEDIQSSDATNQSSSSSRQIQAKRIIAPEWTPEEDDMLKKSLRSKPRMSTKEIAKKLGRSEQSCRNRLNHIIFTTQLRDVVDPMHVMDDREFKKITGKALNDEEKSILVDRLGKGMILPEIALELHKSLRSCKKAMESLKLTVKKARSNAEPIDSGSSADSIENNRQVYMKSRIDIRAQLAYPSPLPAVHASLRIQSPENPYFQSHEFQAEEGPFINGNGLTIDESQQAVDFSLPELY